MFKNWNLFEKIWLAFFSLFAIYITIKTEDSLLNFTALITGILCVVLAAKGSLWTYIYGMVNSFTYAYVSYENGLFGDMGLNLYFFVPMNIIGYIMWKNKMNESTVLMRKLTIKILFLTIIASAIGCFLLGYYLSKIQGQNTPYMDATTNVLSIVATFLMVLRYKEQWLLYIVLNIVTIAMWFIRWQAGSGDGPMMVLMWVAFLINAVYGYYKWHQGAKLSKELV
jgi:nicotinamide mononucleotide transporter